MKMIRHEDVGVNLRARLGACLGERLDEASPIRLVLEDWLAPVPAIRDVTIPPEYSTFTFRAMPRE